ncbi:MAG: NAD(P)/FAD-dependent oxidoreductase [Thermoleophilia bacterium]|nr:NAD(P)/FAD-dependent oxidoreductase [Thermoleophilia bacterium]
MNSGHTIIGGGPAGLTAALVLARAGAKVRVLERRAAVGARFRGDFQGLENWTQRTDALDRLAYLGVEPDFAHLAVHEVTFYDARLRPTIARSRRPLFYMICRGDLEASLDRSLLRQARAAGVRVRLGERAEEAPRKAIIATGPRRIDGLARGYVFSTDLPDQVRAMVSDEVAPGGYAYLLVWGGRATLAACAFRRDETPRVSREAAADAFRRLIPGLELEDARPFAGCGSVMSPTRFRDADGRLYIGEAAGLQDPEWGFGLWYAIESGALAARCLLESRDYAAEARRAFDAYRSAAFFNRLLFEVAPRSLIGQTIRHVGGASDARERFRRHCAPASGKVQLARACAWVLHRRQDVPAILGGRGSITGASPGALYKAASPPGLPSRRTARDTPAATAEEPTHQATIEGIRSC